MTETQRSRNTDWQSGVFALLSLFLLAAAWVWFKGVPLFHDTQKFSVRWHDIDGLIANAAVKINGVQIGSVSNIDLEGKDDVLVGIDVNHQRIVVPIGAKFSILSYGLVGAKFVDITLPTVQPGAAPLPRLRANDVAIGIDPTRTELVAEKLAKNLNNIDLDKVDRVLTADMQKIACAADDLHQLSGKLDKFADKAATATDQAALLAQDLRKTSRSINKILGDPHTSSDLRQTAQSMESTVHQLNETLSNQDMRQDIKESLSDLNQSTEHIQNSVGTLRELSNNDKLRTDMKQILDKTDNVVTKVNTLMTSKDVNPQMKSTLAQTQDAVQHLDIAARQVNQILDTRRPLLKMLFGRPGHLKQDKQQTADKAVDTH
ncbi:MAG TPA: MlaD family protein [Trichormus sp.]